MFLLFYNYLPLEKCGALSFNKFESPSQKDALCQICWNWPSGSGEEDENVFDKFSTRTATIATSTTTTTDNKGLMMIRRLLEPLAQVNKNSHLKFSHDTRYETLNKHWNTYYLDHHGPLRFVRWLVPLYQSHQYTRYIDVDMCEAIDKVCFYINCIWLNSIK